MSSNVQLNYLQPSKATLSVYGAEEFSFNVQTFKIPKIFGYTVEQPTPNLSIPLPGNKLVYDLLEVSVIVTENLESYLNILNWMYGIYAPFNTDMFKNKKRYLERIDLTVYSAANNPIYRVKFEDAFPVRIDEILFDSEQIQGEPVKTKVEFAFKNFVVEKI